MEGINIFFANRKQEQNKTINIIICYEGYFWNTMARNFLYFLLLSLSLLAFLCYETKRCMELTEQALATCIKKQVSVETFSISEQSTINCYVNESWECLHDSRQVESDR